MADLDAIRTRHAAADRWIKAPSPSKIDFSWQAHADRGALLAALDAMTRERDHAEELLMLNRTMRAYIAFVLARDEHADAQMAADAARERIDSLQAALDRLAAVTVEEVAKHLAEWTPDGTVTRIERDMAASVLALVRARVRARVAQP